MNSKISVALCTYNGEKYLSKQLDSILSQSLKADEIIIFDDCSKDKTKDILKEYVRNNSQIKVFLNENNVGYRQNFSNALAKCSGEYIFLADQDDIWDKDKIKSFVEVFEKNASVNVVSSDIALIDSNDNFISNYFRKDFPTKFTSSRTQFKSLMKNALFPGMSLGIRKTLLEKCLPVPSVYPHDEWIAINASLTNSILILDKSYSLYRQHNEQTIGLHHSFKEAYNNNKIIYNEYQKAIYLEANLKFNQDKTFSQIITKKKVFNGFRIKQRKRNWLWAFACVVFNFAQISRYFYYCRSPLKSIVKDILMHEKSVD